MAGFFLPLSGGIDSSSTAAIVASMCELVMESSRKGSEYAAEHTLYGGVCVYMHVCKCVCMCV